MQATNKYRNAINEWKETIDIEQHHKVLQQFLGLALPSPSYQGEPANERAIKDFLTSKLDELVPNHDQPGDDSLDEPNEHFRFILLKTAQEVSTNGDKVENFWSVDVETVKAQFLKNQEAISKL